MTPQRRVPSTDSAPAPPANRKAWTEQTLMAVSLFVTVAATIAGALAHLAGAGAVGDALWIAASVVGIAISLLTTVQSLLHSRLGVDVIALLALAGAVAVREYLAGAVIAVMLASGRALEGWADGRARRELDALVRRAPTTAHLYRDGHLATVELREVGVGDLVMVAAGEVVPVDGFVESANAVLDESALTGEPLPVRRIRGEPVRSGVVVTGAPVDVRVGATARDSTYEGVIRLVAQASSSDVPFVRLADRYALGFLGVTLAVAGVAWYAGGALRAVAVLVVATPCPLILAAPVAFVSGLSRAAARGIVVKGGGVLERLSTCPTLLLDKTGTMTMGRPELEEIACVETTTPDEVLTWAASLDQVSPHVIASAVVAAALERRRDLSLPTEASESAGQGIVGVVGARRVAVGDASWCGFDLMPPWAKSAQRRARLDGSLTVFVSVDHEPTGLLILRDSLRPDAARTIRSLRSHGIDRVVLVTGDRQEVAAIIGAAVGADQVVAECSPEDKLDVVRDESRRAPTVMVGDGINDAPALALASVGVALGSRGATAASEAADVVLTADRIDRLGEAMTIAHRTKRIATQSMVVGIGLSLVAMAVASAGYLPAVGGAFLQEAIDVAVILNALRALGAGPGERRLQSSDAALTQRFRDEHLAIRADIDRLRRVADSLGRDDLDGTMGEVRAVYRVLVDEVEPHERAEEELLYPALGRFIGGDDPMGAMSRGHVEIAQMIRRMSQVIDDIDDIADVDASDLTELRSVMYGLYAVLKLHTAQEDESYLSLGDETRVDGADPTEATPAAGPPAAGPPARNHRRHAR